jgi:hypothetical protein
MATVGTERVRSGLLTILPDRLPEGREGFVIELAGIEQMARRNTYDSII